MVSQESESALDSVALTVATPLRIEINFVSRVSMQYNVFPYLMFDISIEKMLMNSFTPFVCCIVLL